MFGLIPEGLGGLDVTLSKADKVFVGYRLALHAVFVL